MFRPSLADKLDHPYEQGVGSCLDFKVCDPHPAAGSVGAGNEPERHAGISERGSPPHSGRLCPFSPQEFCGQRAPSEAGMQGDRRTGVLHRLEGESGPPSFGKRWRGQPLPHTNLKMQTWLEMPTASPPALPMQNTRLAKHGSNLDSPTTGVNETPPA